MTNSYTTRVLITDVRHRQTFSMIQLMSLCSLIEIPLWWQLDERVVWGINRTYVSLCVGSGVLVNSQAICQNELDSFSAVCFDYPQILITEQV